MPGAAATAGAGILRLCIDEGLDNDEIVILSRDHQPTLEAFESDPEAMVELLLAKFRPEAPAPSRPVYLEWAEASEAPAAVSWCVEGWIEQGDSVSLTGPAKLGKSLLTLEAAACKATGGSFLGLDVTQGPVLYLDWENRPEAVFRRLLAMGFPLHELDDLKYVCFPPLPPLDTQAGSGAVLEMVQETGAELLVIDTLQRVMTGEENNSQGIRDLYRLLLMPLRADGVAVLRLDHVGKGDRN